MMLDVVSDLHRSRKVVFALIALALCFGVTAAARGDDEKSKLQIVPGTPLPTIPLMAPPAASTSPHGDASSPATAGGTEITVYSNTESDQVVAIGANQIIADDIYIPLLCGCDLTRYELMIDAGGDGSGPGVTVDVALYDGCPTHGTSPGDVIPGTAGSVFLPNDGIHTVVYTPPNDDTTIPSAFWIGASFDRSGVGPLFGGEPSVGFSDNIFGLENFGSPCTATFSPTPVYASFAFEVFCEEPGPPDVEMPDPPHGAGGVPPTTTLAWNGSEASALTGEDEPIDQPFSVYDCGHQHPNETLAQFQAAVARGEVEDPANKTLPEVAPRTYFGPSQDGVAGFTVPNVTADDLYWYEDSADLLVSNFSSGQLYGLMADATNDVLDDYGDNFDFIGFFLNFTPHHQIGGAFYLGLENDVTGIGLNTFNNRPSFGIAGQNVEGWVMMWNEANWGTGAFSSTQLVLGQEFEHRFAMFLDPLPGGLPLQGTSGCGRESHWNFRVDAQGSGMEVQEWSGSSPAFRNSGTLSFNDDIGGVFSYPDLYLMGYVLPGEMDTMASELRYMNTSCSSPYGGTITHWDSSDIIQVHGPRVPNSLAAQKHFSTAWVVFHRPGSPPSTQEQNRIVQMLNHWNDQYILGTLNRGTMTNVLHPGDGPQFCSNTSDVLLDTSNPPTTVVCSETTDTTCDPPGDLVENQTYFWRVISTNDEGETQGPVWSFTTGESGPDCNNNGIPDNVEIANCNGDPDCSDCNNNSIPDECDIAECGVDPGCDDCDGNGVPDACDPDCQPNGTPDACDIAGGAPDCDNNTIPDACELTGNDCNNNGMPDACDLAGNDCNSNGTPDDCELVGNDCNGNNIPDDCELSGNDCNANNTPDDCELAGNDCNANGTPDDCEPDCQPNGEPDDCDIAGGAPDCNGNGTPDSCELVGNDCNSNGIPDDCELAGNDCNGNSVPDDCELVGNDCNANNTPDDCELAGNDCNTNNVPDDCELTGNDCNSNGTPDECEPDCQPNGEPDDCDIAGGAPDCNGNDVPDACELAGNDCNSNGVPDECDLAGNDCNTNNVPDDCELDGNDCNASNVPDDCELVDNDCDENGTPDECDLAACGGDPACADCNTNDILDGCDIDDGGSPDTNGNGIPDECECVFTSAPTPPPGVSCVSDESCANLAVCVEGTCYTPRNRYLSFDARNVAPAGELAALRVTHEASGMSWWITTPDSESGKGQLADAPVCLDWSTAPALVHLGDCRISPINSYAIQAVGCDCDFEDEGNFSESLELPTVLKWGDSNGTLSGGAWSPPNGTPNLDDVLASILVIEADPTAMHYSRSDLGPASPNVVTNLDDSLLIVLSIEGASYPFAAPTACP